MGQTKQNWLNQPWTSLYRSGALFWCFRVLVFQLSISGIAALQHSGIPTFSNTLEYQRFTRSRRQIDKDILSTNKSIERLKLLFPKGDNLKLATNIIDTLLKNIPRQDFAFRRLAIRFAFELRGVKYISRGDSIRAARCEAAVSAG